ncbi:hypothetical protein LSH36_1288g00022 [Paralvinella palmiformis]|uniref:lysozyme n=1 Tax=Paralvinella palmiformis TaxID=53620 RepID=A0AAD9ITL8_9ANNE|nr:hypothetical protein LSH36_1288g00022 [Paralvinella palmiformis]
MFSYLAFVIATGIISGTFAAPKTNPPPSFTQNCLDCICQTEGCMAYEGRCYWDVYSDSCGPFAIKLEYWCDANNIYPCTSDYDQEFRDCTMYYACAVDTVNGYMRRYGEYCTGGRTPTCEDYARIHNGGPKGCTCDCTDGYWNIECEMDVRRFFKKRKSDDSDNNQDIPSTSETHV